MIVSEDGRLSSVEPLPPGEYIATVEVVDRPPVQHATEPFDIGKLPVFDMPWPWPEGTTFSREEIYGDDGR